MMINSTLCYVTRGNEVLMLHRVKKKHDINKDKWIGIGGKFEHGESPEECMLREFYEETSVVCKARDIYSVQFKSEEWCIVFTLDYVSGEPKSDGYENSEVLLLTVDEALARDDITNMSRAILNAYINARENTLEKGDYKSISLKTWEYEIFGV